MLFYLVKVHEKCYDCFLLFTSISPGELFLANGFARVHVDPDRTPGKLPKIKFITYNLLTIRLTFFRYKIS